MTMVRPSALRPVGRLRARLPAAAAVLHSGSCSSPASSSSRWLPAWWSYRGASSTGGSEEHPSCNNNAGSAALEFVLLRRRGYSTFASGYSALTRKTLDSILNLENVKDASPEELTTIWNEYHIGRGHVSAVMGSQLFDVLKQKAIACPLFVIPVRRGQGFINLLLQAQMPYLLFTGLNDYRARGSDATPYLTVTHYTEFAETKGLVLVRGDVVLSSKLSDREATAALEAAHSFYLDPSRYKLVTTFNRDSDEFEFRDVLRALSIPH